MKKFYNVIFFLSLFIVTLIFTRCSENENDKNTIKIAVILPLTGPAAELGEYYKEGIQLYIEEYNAQNEANAEIILEDSKTSPKEGVNAINSILAKEPNLDFVFSHLSSVTLALAPITEKNEIPVIAVSASDELLSQYQYTIRNYIDPKRFAEEAFVYIQDSLKSSNLVLFYVNDDFGNSVVSSLKNKISKTNINISSDEIFNLSKMDYRNEVNNLLDKDPDTIFIVGYGTPLARAIRQVFEQKYQGNIFTGIEITQPEVLNLLEDISEPIHFINLPFNDNIKLEENTKFIKNYQEKFNRSPISASALGYDGVRIGIYLSQLSDQNDLSFIQTLLEQDSLNSLNGTIKVSKRDLVYKFKYNQIKNGNIISNE